jgi:hypothetical protein
VARAAREKLRNTARAERSSDGRRRRVTGLGAHTLTLWQQERHEPETADYINTAVFCRL